MFTSGLILISFLKELDYWFSVGFDQNVLGCKGTDKALKKGVFDNGCGPGYRNFFYIVEFGVLEFGVLEFGVDVSGSRPYLCCLISIFYGKVS